MAKKTSGSPSFIVLLLLCVVLIAVALLSPSYTKSNAIKPMSMKLADYFSNGVPEYMGDALDSIYNINKVRVIPEYATCGSEPDEDRYGETDDPAYILTLHKDAAKIGFVSDTDLAFSENANFYGNPDIKYYFDESILVICWKENIDGCVYNFSEVFIAHASQFRRYLVDDAFGSVERLTTSTMAKSTMGVVTMSGDFYAYRARGIVVYHGDVYRNNPTYVENCFIDSDGNLIMTEAYSTGSTAELQAFVDERDISFSLSFGPILVRNGNAITHISDYEQGQPNSTYSRAAIGQLGKCHYLLCTVDGGVAGYRGTIVVRVAEQMAKKGCVSAYALDGGQTATIIFDNKVFNRVGYGSERLISDVIYFASAA